MKFLIVGASGFVGRNVLAYIRAQGFEAIGTQSRAREEGLVKFDLLSDRITECVAPSFFSEASEVCVIVCAVISNMDLCLQDRTKSHKVNVENTIRLIDDVTALKAKIIFLSSCFVFDGVLGYYNEDSPCSPVNEYGRHKAEVEQYLLKNVPDAFIARLDKIVGHDPSEGHLLGYWYRGHIEGKPITCLEGSLLSPTYVQDVARAFVIACEKKLRGIYHVANAEFFYRDELARQFCHALGIKADIVSKPVQQFNFPDKRALKSYLDGSRFTKISGLRFTSMREVFQKFSATLNAGLKD